MATMAQPSRPALTHAEVTRDVIATLGAPSRAYVMMTLGAVAMFLVGLVTFVLLLRDGLGLAGYNPPVMWLVYITTFVFWVGIGHAGTLISAILFLFRSPWRTAVYRATEAMTDQSMVNVSVVDRAVPPLEPESGVLLPLVLGLLSGALLAAAMAVAVEYLNRRLRFEEEEPPARPETGIIEDHVMVGRIDDLDDLDERTDPHDEARLLGHLPGDRDLEPLSRFHPPARQGPRPGHRRMCAADEQDPRLVLAAIDHGRAHGEPIKHRGPFVD